MSITMDKESWERGVRDGFRTGIRGLCPDTADPYSYWAGWSEGEAARRTYQEGSQQLDAEAIEGILSERW